MPPRAIHDLLARGTPLALPGVYDALSALLAARAGFESVFLSGYALSATRLAEPDVGLVDATDVIDAATRVVAAVDVPVVVDADTGYGDAAEAARTVSALVGAGAAGCFLEDQAWPKRCGHMERKRVVPVEEYLAKLRAALAARAGTAFHVTARTDARAPLGIDEAIRRARAFADTGADAVFVEAPESVDEMRRVRDALPRGVTLVANMVEGGKTPLRTLAELARDGYAIVVFPLAGLLAAAHALGAAYETLRRDGATTALASRMTGFGDMNRLLGLEEREREGDSAAGTPACDSERGGRS